MKNQMFFNPIRKSKSILPLLSLAAACWLVSPSTLCAADTFPTRQLKIAVVNFKTCVEKSKIGKQEQGTFEAMKKQMEAILADKEKSLNEMAGKLSDADYLDSLSPDAETELKRKFRAVSQELSQSQQQYLQTLQQANVKIIQKLAETIGKASQKVAKDLKLDYVLNEDGAFFYSPDLDVSNQVVVEMDVIYEKEMKDASAGQPAAAPTASPAAAPKK